MQSQRAVTTQTASTARIFIARTSQASDGGPYNKPGITVTDDGSATTVPPRLPSLRPIDKRWDHSRSIVLASTSPASASTLRPSRGIGMGTGTRQYATRPLNRTPPPPQAARPTSYLDNPHIQPPPRSGAQDMQKLAELSNQIFDLKKELEAERLSRQASAKKHVEEIAKLNVKDQELSRRLVAMQQNNAEEARKGQAAKQLAIAQVKRLQESKIVNLEKQTKTWKEKASQSSAEATQLQTRIGEMKSRNEQDLDDQRKLLEMQYDRKLRTQRGQRLTRENERRTYDDYRKVFDSFAESIRGFRRVHESPDTIECTHFFKAANYTKSLRSYSAHMEKINPLIIRTNTKLFERLDRSLQEHKAAAEKGVDDFRDLRARMQELVTAFQEDTHGSRALTRYHRINETQNKMSTADIQHYVANDKVFREISDAFKEGVAKVRTSAKSETSKVVTEQERVEIAKLTSQHGKMRQMVSVLQKIRDVIALKALLTDELPEKAAYTETMNARVNIDDAGRSWNTLLNNAVFDRTEGASHGEEMSQRRMYNERAASTRAAYNDLLPVVRRRVWLEQHLGLFEERREREVDAVIRERIELKKREQSDALERLWVHGARVGRSDSFARPAFGPVAPSRVSIRRAREVRGHVVERVETRASSSTRDDVTSETTRRKSKRERERAIFTKKQLVNNSAGSTRQQHLQELVGLQERNLKSELERLRSKRQEASGVGNVHELAVLDRSMSKIAAAIVKHNTNLERIPQPTDRLEKNPLAGGGPRRTLVTSSPIRYSGTRSHSPSIRTGRRSFSTTGQPASDSSMSHTPAPTAEADLRAIENAMQHASLSENTASIYTDDWARSSSSNVRTNGKDRSELSSDTYNAPPESFENTHGLRKHGSTIDTPPLYRVPDSAYREAAVASPNSNAAYWSYRLYRDRNGKTPSVHYCTSLQSAERELQHFIGQPLIGFDMEWDSTANKQASAKRNASLIQVACEDRICLVQVARFPGETAEHLVPPSLRTILESEDTIKAGVNIQGDARRMREYLNVEVRGQFELSHLYKVVTFQPATINKTLKGASMAVQVQNILRLPLKKDDVRVSAWARPLNQEQCDYSASDAYAGYQLFRALEVRRKLMVPMPPRPAFQELKLPLVLGDGAVLRPKPASAGAAGKAGKGVKDEDEENEEEFYDAVEVQELAMPLIRVDITYPSLPPFEEVTEGASYANDKTTAPSGTLVGIPDQHPTNTQAPPEDKSTTTPSTKSTAPPSQELELANVWVTTYNPVPSSTKKATPPNLRAYHLWHIQRLEPDRIAALLKQPPLAITTVASYVLEAVKLEGLPFDTGRLKGLMGMLPKVAGRRYWSVLGRTKMG
ncbi:hypothetical protein LTR62_006578 [Meristemomyces frigidus]|uniref:3'-5' exonuclease domain-containing protein n=1 Tax=Meristemomyces frigidus TaxID=1508187 RepID=A0AAN7TDW4_9PEZI|nr:hypothetical protein LTR62_006578 [Meristemomyces frigidus]